MDCQINKMNFSKKSQQSIKKQFDSEPAYNDKYLNLKKNLIREKPTQVFSKIKYLKKLPTYLFIWNLEQFCF